MTLVSVQGVSKYFSADPVVDQVSLEIRAGERWGLIGPNGCGKTTLLNLIAGVLEPDRGRVELARAVRCGYLRQTLGGDLQQSVWSYAESAFAELLAARERAEYLAASIAVAQDAEERRRLALEYDDLQERLLRAGGFQFDHQIHRILSGVGFRESQFSQAIGTLSGGQANRLMLAHLLLAAPDLMLLDEPSNHLDMAATEWLEQFLQQSTQAFIVVSHDRYLLDRVTEHTIELLGGSTELYSGNYSKYVVQKSQRLEVQRRTYERQQEEVARLEDFIRRNHYGQKAAQAEDRRKKLEQIERVPPPREIEAPPMAFPPAARCGDLVLKVQGLGKRFDRPLFDNLNMQVERGERWGILGPNGSGKTSLIRCLVGQDPEYQGSVQWGTGVATAYFDQSLASVPDQLIPLEAIRPTHKEMFDQARRDLLARFGIVGDLALQPIAQLSGGQRNRVALAKLAATDANVLIFDEPTNHLDLWSREALAHAILAFEGTVLIVSHDRYLINQVCDHLLVFESERVRVIDGNYDTYRLLTSRGAAAAVGMATPPAGSVGKPKSAAGESGRRKRRFPYRKVEDLEAEIATREAAVADLQQQLTTTEVLRSKDRVLATQTALQQESETLSHLYEHWAEAVEMN